MGIYLIAAFVLFVGIAYMIFSRISSVAYAARPFDTKAPPRSPARYFLKVHRELYPNSMLPGVCALSGIIAAMILIAASYTFLR